MYTVVYNVTLLCTVVYNVTLFVDCNKKLLLTLNELNSTQSCIYRRGA